MSYKFLCPACYAASQETIEQFLIVIPQEVVLHALMAPGDSESSGPCNAVLAAAIGGFPFPSVAQTVQHVAEGGNMPTIPT